jgi:hypothetical protein
MPTREFALDPYGEQRVQVSWNAVGGDLTVLLNQSIIGTIPGQEASATLWTFPLSDGSVLQVRLVDQGVVVWKNGQPLPSISEIQLKAPLIPPTSPERPKRGGCLTTFLVWNLIVIAIFVIWNIYVAINADMYVNPDVARAEGIFLVLADINQIIGCIALFYWRKWGFYQILGGVGVICLIVFLSKDTLGYPQIGHIFCACGILHRLLRSKGRWNLGFN